MKREVIVFLWVVAAGVSIVTASLDLIGDNRLNWANYLFPGVFSVGMVASAAIWFFTYSCHLCGKLVIMNDNYCKRCGAALTRPAVECEKEVQTQSLHELPTLQQLEQNTLARPSRVRNQSKQESSAAVS